MAKATITLDDNEIREAIASYVGRKFAGANIPVESVGLSVTKEWRGHGTQEYQADVIKCEVTL